MDKGGYYVVVLHYGFHDKTDFFFLNYDFLLNVILLCRQESMKGQKAHIKGCQNE